MYKGSRVLVAGGSGVIGIPIVKELVSRGALVTAVGMESAAVVSKYLPANVNYVQGNLQDLNYCKSIFRNHSIILNLAGAKRSVSIGYKGISKFFVSMIKLQTNIMEIAHELKVERFLFVGSISEYPSIEIRSEDQVWNGKPAQNDWFTGVQKRMGESQSEAYFLDTGWDAVRIIRPSNVYGPFDNFTEENGQVIPALISKLFRNSRKLQIIGDGTNLRDFIFADDVAYWALEALEKSPPNYPLNIGSGMGTSVKEIAESLVDIFGGNTLIEYRPAENSGDKIRILDIERAKTTIGFKPSISIKEGLKRTVNWIKTNENWKQNKYL